MGYSDISDSVYLTQHLLNVCETLLERGINVHDRLRQEVANVTKGRAHLLFGETERIKRLRSTSSNVAMSLFVQFGHITYGTLVVEWQSGPSSEPALARPTAEMIAHICGSILYILELLWMVQSITRKQEILQFPPVTRASFTKRQWTVLMLMCQGYTQQEIAQSLTIALSTAQKHRQAVYARLHVRDEREVPLVAYQLGLFSPLHNEITKD